MGFFQGLGIFFVLVVAFGIGLVKSLINHPIWWLTHYWWLGLLVVFSLWLGHRDQWRWRRR